MASDETMSEIEFSDGERAAECLTAAMTDERNGKPSASGMNCLHKCPGSRKISAGCPNISTAASQSGDRVHAATHTGDTSKLLDDEIEAYHRNVALMEEIRARLPADAVEYSEKRLWLLFGMDQICSGQLDRFWIYEEFGRKVAVAVDWKTGWRDEDDFDAQSDLQLRTQAVLLYQVHKVDQVKIGFYLPRRDQDLWVTYYEEDLATAFMEIVNFCIAAEEPYPRIQAGPHCRYCPGQIRCSAWKAASEITPPQTTVQALSNDELKGLFHAVQIWKQHADTAEAIDSEVKRRKKAGENLPWAVLVENPSKREIKDMIAAYELLKDWIPFEDLAAGVSLPIGKTETLFWKALNKVEKTTQKKAKELLNKRLEGVITYKKTEPSIRLSLEDA